MTSGSTTTESGSCMHGNTTRTGGLLYVSADDGRSFDRYEVPDAAIDDLGARDGEFFVLVSRAEGFSVSASIDGVQWDRRIDGASAYDLIVDATGLHVAHDGGVLSSADGVAWTDHRVDGAGLYAPHLVSVDGRFVLATGDGALSTSTDGARWTPHAIASLTSVHRLATAGDRAIAIAHADRDGGAGSYLVAFDPATDAPASFVPIDDGVRAVIDAPAGLLIGDGTLAADGDVTTRRAHTAAFLAGAVDDDRVILATDDSLTISSDGGATFAAPVALPLLR